jgi:hypothetical protein
MYYAFYCEQVATAVYTTELLVLSLFGFTFPFFPVFHTDKYPQTIHGHCIGEPATVLDCSRL